MATRHAAWILAAWAVATLAEEPAPPAALTASQVVERNAAARGGVEAWRAVQSMVWTGHVDGAGRSGRRAPFQLEQKRPDRSRFEITIDGLKTVRVFDGRSGWKVGAGAAGRLEVQAFTADESTSARGAPLIEGPLMAHASRGAIVSLAGLQEVEGRKAYALDLRLPSGGAYRVWVDAETFLERRYDRALVSAAGRPILTSVFFADYRAVGGLQIPFAIETGTLGGAARDRLVIEQVALNPALDDRRFERPPTATARRGGVTIDTRAVARPGSAPAAR